jgi:hypothetical protein
VLKNKIKNHVPQLNFVKMMLFVETSGMREMD